jgi:putative transposase
VRKAFTYRLYPNRAQAAAMAAILESHRALYNAALEHRRTAYQMHRVTVTFGPSSVPN